MILIMLGRDFDKVDIGREIIILRAQYGLTQQQFAEKLGTTQRTVATWESGASVPRKTMRVKIATTFGLPDTRFLTDENSGEGAENSEAESMTVEFEDLLDQSNLEIPEDKKMLLVQAFQKIINSE